MAANMYDLMAMMKEDQTPLMMRGIAPEVLAQAAQTPQRAPAQAVTQARMENPNSAQVTPPAPARLSLMDMLRQKTEAGNLAQSEAIKKIEDQMAASQNAPKQTDWSALAGLTDTWTGSNFSKSYQKPETDAERAQKLLALQTQLLGAKDKITDNDMNMLRSQIQIERDDQRMNHETALENLKAQALNKALGAKQISAADVNRFNEGNQIPSQLADISTVLENNQDLFGPVMGRIKGNNPYNERAQTAQSSIKTAAQSFGRFMEGGVLRAEDEKKYREMFPSLSDTPEVAKNKLQVVNKLLIDKQNSLMGALQGSGYNISGIDKNLQGTSLPNVLTAPRGGQAPANEDSEAVAWAKANMSDPRAAAILKANGGM